MNSLQVPRVVLQHRLAQHAVVKVRVHLGGRNATVAEHELDVAQVDSVLKQVRGKRVAHGVRTDDFTDSGQRRQLFEPQKHPLAADLAPANIQKKMVLKAALGLEVHPL